jgi:hypothetical protein
MYSQSFIDSWKEILAHELSKNLNVSALALDCHYVARIPLAKHLSAFKNAKIMRCRRWLRQSAASRKVTVPIPEEVILFSNLPNHSGLTMALGLTQPLTEITTRKSFWEQRTTNA